VVGTVALALSRRTSFLPSPSCVTSALAPYSSPSSVPPLYSSTRSTRFTSPSCLAAGYVHACNYVHIGPPLTPTQAREAVFATRQSLGLMKSKLKGAQTGHDLLKRKSEALTKYVSIKSAQINLD